MKRVQISPSGISISLQTAQAGSFEQSPAPGLTHSGSENPESKFG